MKKDLDTFYENLGYEKGFDPTEGLVNLTLFVFAVRFVHPRPVCASSRLIQISNNCGGLLHQVGRSRNIS